MMAIKRKEEAKANFDRYLEDGLLKKEKNEISKEMYIKNAELSLQVAQELSKSGLKPHLWVIVCSYYSMFYIANAVLLSIGYKTQDKIAHKVTSDALIVLVIHRLKKELIEDYESTMDDALEIAAAKAEDMMGNYDLERDKRSKFQYNMLEQMKESKASTSLKRAQEFLFEMRKLL
jgi:uncharacterized protein (UPF0332 family)